MTTAAPPDSSAPVLSPPSPPRRRRAGANELGLLGIILVLGGLLAACGGTIERRVRDPQTGEQYILTRNKFLNVDRLLTLAKNTSFFAIMAIGATLVIVSGGIDLSVGGIYVLSGLAGASLLHALGPSGTLTGWPPWVVVLATMAVCLLTGLACGLINGLGVIGLGLHPFLITLGTMSIFRGVAFVATRAQSIGEFHPAFVDGFISRKMSLGTGEFIYPIPLLILIAVALWGYYFLAQTVTGRKLLAIGGNETAARYAGLNVAGLKVLTYALAGVLAGIAAMVNIGYHGSAASGDGAGYELQVIAAAVVGGASLSGGRGTALGAVLGALIICLIVDAIVVLDLDQNYSQIIVGLVIVAAATLDRWQAVWRRTNAVA
ncbi:MAG: ABC transporter permease [Planctomycetaceae bacterium]